MKAMESHQTISRGIAPLGLGLITLVLSTNLSASESQVIATQYAGGDKVAVRWESGYLEEGESLCGYYPVEYGYRSSGEHAIFSRAQGGDYQLAVDLERTSDQMWFGSIPGLSETNALELQVRLKDLLTGTYCEPSDDTSSTIDTSDRENQPSFSHTGDILLTEFELVTYESDRWPTRYNINYRVDNWASNFSDGNDQSHRLLNDKVYFSPYGLNIDFDSFIGFTSTDLRGRSRYNAPSPEQIDYTDNLSVFNICNSDPDIDDLYQWIGACSEEAPVIVSAGPTAVGAENVPSFEMTDSLAIGEDYSMQEYPDWATSIDAGANATASSDLQFQTLWVTNSTLYEVAPWISYPSGRLRFKFKDGATGVSRIYISLSDWDLQSPENQLRHIEVANYADHAPDHSRIKYVDISVGNEGAARTMSSGARGADMVQDALAIESRAANGGGGAGGLALFGLMGLALTRRRSQRLSNS